MTAKTILCPTDFSASSDAPLAYAAPERSRLAASRRASPARRTEHSRRCTRQGRNGSGGRKPLARHIDPETLVRLLNDLRDPLNPAERCCRAEHRYGHVTAWWLREGSYRRGDVVMMLPDEAVEYLLEARPETHANIRFHLYDNLAARRDLDRLLANVSTLRTLLQQSRPIETETPELKQGAVAPNREDARLDRPLEPTGQR
jgi:hypothetical protein